MNDNLEKNTKQAMGFLNIANTCRDCKYQIEEEDPYLDRSWYYICQYSNLCSFRVELNSTCNKFHKK